MDKEGNILWFDSLWRFFEKQATILSNLLYHSGFCKPEPDHEIKVLVPGWPECDVILKNLFRLYQLELVLAWYTPIPVVAYFWNIL